MNSKHLEWKVGFFVLIGLCIMGVMMVKLSKGMSALGGTYQIVLSTSNIGGVQKDAAVRMAGVRVGQITHIDYDSDKLEVVLKATIGRAYRIPSNAIITIETSGFLGEQFVSITPQANPEGYLEEGAHVAIKQPFNLQEAARTAMTLVHNVNTTVSNLNSTLVRVDRLLLNDKTLSNLTGSVSNIHTVTEESVVAIGNFRKLSERSVETMDGLDRLLETNSPAITGSISNILVFSSQIQAVTNLIKFSEQLNNLGMDIRRVVDENKDEISTTMKNFESASSNLKDMMSDLRAGKGLAGSLLNDPEMDRQASVLLGNMAVLSSNLNRFGFLYKPRNSKTSSTNTSPHHKPIF